MGLVKCPSSGDTEHLVKDLSNPVIQSGQDSLSCMKAQMLTPAEIAKLMSAE